ASTASFVAQCYELHRPPALGSLVKTGDRPLEIFGVVCFAETRSLEEGRKPVARGGGEEAEDVFRTHPQLVRLLCTDFRALVVGYRDGERLFQRLPPQPARIHGFVYQCSAAELREFSSATDFLKLLVADQSFHWVDEVIAACLRCCAQTQDDPDRFLVSAGKELALLLGGDFQRLSMLLRRVRA
ncbi:MAG: hypothetical protein AB1793_09850, partial [Candidatus Thermoplasmatota archaeon]